MEGWRVLPYQDWRPVMSANPPFEAGGLMVCPLIPRETTILSLFGPPLAAKKPPQTLQIEQEGRKETYVHTVHRTYVGEQNPLIMD